MKVKEMSKGSKQRPVDQQKFNDNWEKIFGKTRDKPYIPQKDK